jgi:hypothetical protein
MPRPEEAKTKCCPFDSTFCMAERCMAWWWLNTEELIGRCLLIPEHKDKESR